MSLDNENSIIALDGAVDNTEESTEGDSSFTNSYDIKFAKQDIKELTTAYDHAYARAFINAPDTARHALGIEKPTKEILVQIATNDSEVKAIRIRLDKAQRHLLELELAEKKRLAVPKDVKEIMEKVWLSDFNDNAHGIFKAIEDELWVISENLSSITKALENEKAGVAGGEFWREEVLENMAGYKTNLTINMKILDDIQGQFSDKLVLTSIKSVMRFAWSLLDCCKTYERLSDKNLRLI